MKQHGEIRGKPCGGSGGPAAPSMGKTAPRRDAVEKLRTMQKDGTISEDDLRRFQDQVQKVTDAHIEQIDGLHRAKEREIMEG